MRVLLANKFFFRNGGSEAVFFDERRFLIDQGISVVDFSMKDDRNQASDFSSHFVTNKTYSAARTGPLTSLMNGLGILHSFESVSKLGALIDEVRPDILHCHNIYHQLTPSILRVARSRGIPVVLTLHDYKTVCPTYLRLKHGEACSDCLGGGFFHVVRNRCAEGSLGKSALLYAEAVVQRWAGSYEAVDLVIAPSRFMADSVTTRFEADRIRVLHNGIDLDKITPSRADEGYALYLGRLSKEKGVKTLLEAHRAASPGFALKICGTGPLEAELRAGAPTAEFLGYLTGDALRNTVAAASVIVVPSEWYENCPMAILEAMAFGKPVIASRIGGIPELVEHGETGLLFEPGNVDELRGHLTTLMGDAPLRAGLGAAARARVEQRFSRDRHNQTLLTYYRELLAPNRTEN